MVAAHLLQCSQMKMIDSEQDQGLEILWVRSLVVAALEVKEVDSA